MRAEPEAGELSWGRPDWFGYWEAEHTATRDGRHPDGHVVHGEVRVQGRDAGQFLEQLSGNNVDTASRA